MKESSVDRNETSPSSAEDDVAIDVGGGHVCGPPDAVREALEGLASKGGPLEGLAPCAATLHAQLRPWDATASSTGMLAEKMPEIADVEGRTFPGGRSDVVDAHVHLFPDRLFEALWAWFDAYGWPVRYRLKTPEVVSFLLGHGVKDIVALHYPHQPNMAVSLNAYMQQMVQEHAHITGLATVYPGEDGAAEILQAGFDGGLRGVKLHCHVQAFSPDDAHLHPVYETCVANDKPLVMHAGREPKSPEYPVDTHATCAAARTEQVLRDYPTLKLVVPHLGADEFDAYLRLVERYENLWIDTTMMAANYFPVADYVDAFLARRPDRILYGTDFPNIPYAWDREARRLQGKHLARDDAKRLFSSTARELFGIAES